MSYSLTQKLAAAAAVGRGAALLDAKIPGWWRKIDLGTLDLANGKQCVLGQVFDEPQQVSWWRQLGHAKLSDALRAYQGVYARSELMHKACTANYDLGKVILKLDDKQIVEAGFNAGFCSGTFVSYRLLDDAWWLLVNDRQRADRAVGR